MSTATDHLYDVIIIGAGVEGSATGYYLTSRHTKNVLLLEQFDALHTRGSSHGCSRITRKAYHKAFYTEMMDSAFKMWSQIERESGKEIYIKTGILIFGDSYVKRYIDALEMNGHSHKIMTGREVNELYPKQFKLPNDYLCVTEEDGGILKANTAVAALQALFVGHGGVLLDNHRVTRVVPGPVVTVETSRGSYRAKKIIVTSGAWTNEVLHSTGLRLPLKVIRTEALYWTVEDGSCYSKESFPCFIFGETGGTHRYGIPVMEYHNLLKVCFHDGLEISEPDQRDSTPQSVTSHIVSRFIEKHLKGVSTTPALTELCMYTLSPDGDSFLDRHPYHPNIVIGAGFSGQGFKLAPVVGKVLAELALDLSPSFDLSPFKISRFNILRSSL